MPLPDSVDSRPVVALPELALHPAKKMLWMYRLPGMTEDLLFKAFEEACAPEKLFIDGQLVNLSPKQWIKLKDYCREKLNLPFDWEDRRYHAVVEEAKRNGWMKTYGPNPVINRKKLKEDKDFGSKNSSEVLSQTSLF